MKRSRPALRLALFLTCALPTACAEKSAPVSVLLITADTLRADHLGAYGAPHGRTPRLDALARAGVVFENAAAPMPLTRPSHFSILTSRYPREHGVLNNAQALPESALSLAEIYREEGYRTAAFVSVVLLDEASGASQGFETFRHPTQPRERPAAQPVGEALAWLDGLAPDEPFFLWVHLFDPHLPYAPPPELCGALDPDLARRLPSLNWKQFFDAAERNDGDVPEAIVEHAHGLYRAEVSYLDTWVGALLDGLDSRGRGADTLTCFTADHGESFEHGVYFEHADSLFDGAIHVPLILAHPTLFAAGTRRTLQVSHVDLAPTLLDATGHESPRDWSGRSLLSLADDPQRHVLIQHPFYQQGLADNRGGRRSVIRSVAGEPVAPLLTDAERVGLVGPRWKLVRTLAHSGDSLALYDRTRGETADLSELEPERRAELETLLDAALERHPLHLLDASEINDELRETLRALGYTD